jgi:hypothetical protein
VYPHRSIWGILLIKLNNKFNKYRRYQMKTRIEEVADEYVKQYDNEPDKSWSRLDFIAGAEFMLGDNEKLRDDNFVLAETLRATENGYNELKAQNEVIKSLMHKLYFALNCAHGYIDPYKNKRTDKLCMEVL